MLQIGIVLGSTRPGRRGARRPYTEALGTTLLGVAPLCAALGATTAHLTLATTARNAMSPDPTPPETAVLRYTVAPQFLEQHLELLREVYAELNALRPTRFSWATYQVASSREFIEVAIGAPLPGPLPDLPSFRRYRADLDARCETRQFDDVEPIGSYPLP